jgi:hypothetical protein
MLQKSFVFRNKISKNIGKNKKHQNLFFYDCKFHELEDDSSHFHTGIT